MAQKMPEVKKRSSKKEHFAIAKMSERIRLFEKFVLTENRWDTWHVGGVREHLALPAEK